jgi:hypothetical protein
MPSKITSKKTEQKTMTTKRFTQAPQKTQAQIQLINRVNGLIKTNMNSYLRDVKYDANDYKDLNRAKQTENLSQVDRIDMINKHSFNRQISNIENVYTPQLVHLEQKLFPLRCYINAKFIETITNGELKQVYGFVLVYHPDMKCFTTETHSINKDRNGNYYDFTKEHFDKDINTKIFLELSRVINRPFKVTNHILTDYLNPVSFYFPSIHTKRDELFHSQANLYHYREYIDKMDFFDRAIFI